MGEERKAGIFGHGRGVGRALAEADEQVEDVRVIVEHRAVRDEFAERRLALRVERLRNRARDATADAIASQETTRTAAELAISRGGLGSCALVGCALVGCALARLVEVLLDGVEDVAAEVGAARRQREVVGALHLGAAQQDARQDLALEDLRPGGGMI